MSKSSSDERHTQNEELTQVRLRWQRCANTHRGQTHVGESSHVMWNAKTVELIKIWIRRDITQPRNECSPFLRIWFLPGGREGGRWEAGRVEIRRGAKISWSILLEQLLQRRTCQKNELRYFRWNPGTISSQQLACGRRMWITICRVATAFLTLAASWERHSFLREHHILGDIHLLLEIARLWTFIALLGFSPFMCSSITTIERTSFHCVSFTSFPSVAAGLHLGLHHFLISGFLRHSWGQGGRLLAWQQHNLPGLWLIANNEIWPHHGHG